jgi:hypothetical protein
VKGGTELDEVERKIKKKKRTEEEKEDDKEMAEVRSLVKEQDRLDYEDAALDLEGSESENEIISLIFKTREERKIAG